MTITDAEAIRKALIAAKCDSGDGTYIHASMDNVVAAILSYLASRREAQEPVAWRYRWKIDGEWVSWRVSERSQASEHLLPSLEEYPLYLAPPAPAPAGEIERLRAELKVAHDALGPFASVSEGVDGGETSVWWRHDGDVLYVEDFIRARAALNGGRADG